ncbi:Y4yA family PLP-dependent enzyme [Leeuwenhoekiella sp. MAR_2009_132]|uniref:Y4yA family PLP-dependent enzyme n=1 Tax=Leeuwenhoekiella sp. MAR_2009_132 TaxID=1392489 RepID=UPI00049024D1|nr:Y4yA family PLP-dependent enzyme [Leeuwenhoekiella sp. MAR_2009_132]
MKNSLPKLEPVTSEWMFKIINDFNLQESLFETYNSPINIHDLPSFGANIKEYQDILSTYKFKSRIFFARKANKFQNLIQAAVENGIGIDTASLQELQQCLELNVDPTKLISTAAIKNTKLLEVAIKNQVLLVIDNKDELDQVAQIAEKLNIQALIGIRISGFEYEGKKLMSRFGFDIDQVNDLMVSYFNEDDKHLFKIAGFHFHLDGYSTAQRGEALHQTLDLVALLKNHFPLSFIDIGGGILMNYLKHQNEWNAFKEELKEAVLEKRDAITYNNDGLGFTNRNGVIEGQLATYPYYNENSKASFLKEILDVANAENKTVYQRLETLDIELRLEPGRSLLNQVGITSARVAHRKIDARGNHLIGLEMNMSQLKSSSADFLLDPFATFKNPDSNAKPVAVYFTGAYCLERDVLLKRKIELPQLPEIGDTITFVNTAGYMMHFFETEAHLFERAKNLSISENKEHFTVDDFKEE